MGNFGEKVTFVWSVADLLRDAFKRSKHPDLFEALSAIQKALNDRFGTEPRTTKCSSSSWKRN